MREMGDIVVIRYPEHKLQQAVCQHEILGFHGYGRDEQHYTVVGVHHAESEQHTEYRT